MWGGSRRQTRGTARCSPPAACGAGPGPGRGAAVPGQGAGRRPRSAAAAAPRPVLQPPGLRAGRGRVLAAGCPSLPPLAAGTRWTERPHAELPENPSGAGVASPGAAETPLVASVGTPPETEPPAVPGHGQAAGWGTGAARAARAGQILRAGGSRASGARSGQWPPRAHQVLRKKCFKCSQGPGAASLWPEGSVSGFRMEGVNPNDTGD